MNITFTPLKEEDFPLLLKWLQAVHVRAWWDSSVNWTFDAILAKYGQYLKAQNKIYAYIILHNNIPIGYIQYYNRHNFPPEPLYDTSGLPKSCAAIDWYIGDVGYTGKGIGPQALDMFVKEYVFNHFDSVVTDSDSTNIAAIKAYQKAGFNLLKQEAQVTLMIRGNIANDIIEIRDLKEIEKCFEKASPAAVILVDIDYTIIIPKAKMFRDNSKHKHFIDDLKKNRDKIPNFENILSSWRLQRKVMLVNERWPELIDKMRQSGRKIYAFTQMDTGNVGVINKVEHWRSEELKSMNVLFTESYMGHQELEILPPHKDAPKEILHSSAKFYHGFFMTGANTKGDLVRSIIAEAKPPEIIFVDDRMDHVKDVGKACADNGVAYIGIFYRGVEMMDGEPDDLLAEKQKKHLLEHGKWLEDDGLCP